MEETRVRIVSRRRGLQALAALPLFATGWWCDALAAAPRRLAILVPGPREEVLAQFPSQEGKALAERGWVEGKTLEVLWGFDNNDESRIPILARELVAARPDVIGTVSTVRTRALQRATRTIPIYTSVGDPVGAGFAQSLVRPGGNITGLSFATREIAQKQIEVLRAAVPKLSAMAILGATKSTAYLHEIAQPTIQAAQAAGISVQPRQVSTLHEMEIALRGLPPAGHAAVYFMGNLGDVDVGAVMQLAIRLRVPAMVAGRELVEKGGLLTYTLNHENETQRTADIVDKLLRGADPATIPFELPTKSDFVVNRRTAAAIGVKLPAELLLRADEVIG